MGEGVWPNRHVTFIVAEKSLIHSSSYSIYGYVGEGWFEKSYEGGVGRKRKNTVI